ncbi:MAG: ATP-grasp domain-containing protein [Patescibacteria group bacterium]
MPNFPRKTVLLVSPDPRKIEGLELAWPHFKIFVSKLSPALRRAERAGVEIVNLKLPKIKNTSDLLSEMLARKLVKKGNRVLVFKNLPKIEKLAAKHNFELLMPAAKFVGLLEDKINFVDFCHEFALPILPTKISELNLVRFLEPIVVQLRRGHAGQATFFIRSPRELDNLKRKIGDFAVKITPLKKLPTFSLDLCVTGKGIFATQPFFQITGEPKLNPLPGGTGGIDFDIGAGLSEATRERVGALVELVGQALEKIGYRGIAGIDFLVDDAKHHIYLLELNPRLLSNLGFVTRKQIEAGELPLTTIHLLEFLGEDVTKFNPPRLSQVNSGRFENPHPDAHFSIGL